MMMQHWQGVDAFLRMGGNAGTVWGCYGLVLGCVGLLAWRTQARYRRVMGLLQQRVEKSECQ